MESPKAQNILCMSALRNSSGRRRQTLMPHDLPKAYDPAGLEDQWAEYWVREKLFAQPTPDSATDPVNLPDGQSPLYHSAAAAQRDGASAHGPYAQPDGDGHPHPLAAHERAARAVAAGHRPRGHRHADDGRAAVGEEGKTRQELAARPSSSASGSGSAIMAAPFSTR